MKYSVLFLSLLLWGVANSATIIDQELEDVSQERALEMVKDAFFNKDVDYYLCTDSVDKWTFFVDAEPLKGWEHKCFIATIPKKILAGRSVFPNLTTLQLPPSGNITPVEVKKRYGINSTEKPNVIAESLPNYVLTAAERTYAVIISGGVNKTANHERYWNDCSFIYQTLRKRYGVPRSNINIIMSDGTDTAADMRTIIGGYKSSPLDLDNDGTNDVQYSATRTNVRNVLNSLSSKLNSDDHLFIFVIDHGGSNDGVSSSYINLWGESEVLHDYELADWLTPFTNKCVNVNVVLGQCFSGGFVDDLTKVGCVVATAASGSEYSWSCSDRPYDEFVYQWTSAINQANSYGASIDSDIDNNGRVTMDEAFTYAKNNDRASETPQYISTPLSVGEDLAFNNLAPAVDLYIKDNNDDTGKEPNLTTDVFWNSPDVWIRNFDDNVEIHENPYYASDHLAAIVYVRVTNRGKKRFDGSNRWVHVNWAKASTGLTVKAWKGRELYNNTYVTGGALNPSAIPALEPGESCIVKTTWALPNNLMEEDISSEKHHFCLLARILDTHYIDEYQISDPSGYDLKGHNDYAQKNVSIISALETTRNTSVFVRNVLNVPQNYSLEIRPHQETDAQIFTNAKIEMKMSQPILSAWKRGGTKYKSLSYTPAIDSLKVVFTSSDSKLENIQLSGNEFEKVSLKFNFHTATPIGTKYSFDLIQRDENGIIVGGETFIVETPLIRVDPIIITPLELEDGKIKLVANLDGTESFTEWTDNTGTTISESSSVTVTPTSENSTYSLKVLNADGELATGSITLEPTNGIKSATPTTSVTDYIDIEFKTEVSSSNSMISVNSTLQGITVLNMSVPIGTKIVRMDTSSLAPGLYVLSYIVDGQIIDTLKFSK